MNQRRKKLLQIGKTGIPNRSDLAAIFVERNGTITDIKGASIGTYAPTAPAGGKYYIDKVSGTWRYKLNTWPSASDTAASANNIQGCLDDLDGAGNIIVIPPKEYTGADISATGRIVTGNTNTILQSPQSNDVPYPGYSGRFTLDATGYTDQFLYVAHTGWTFRGMKVQNLTASGKYALYSLQVANFRDVVVEGCNQSILSSGGTYNVHVINNLGSVCAAFISANATTFNFSIFEGSLGTINIGNASNVINFNNTIFTKFRAAVLNGLGSMGTANLKNCLFFGNTRYTTLYPYVVTTNGYGTWNFDHCYRAGNARSNGIFLANSGGTATVSYTNDIPSMPSITSNWGEGKTFFHIDDGGNYLQFKALADLAETYGYKACFGASWYGSAAIDWEELASYVNNGHEVSIHCHSGSRLGTANAFTAVKGGSTITISVTRSDPDDSSTWAGTLTVLGESAIDLASESYNTLKKVVTYLATVGVTTGAASPQINYATAVDGYEANPLCLESAVYDIGTIKTVLFNEEAFFQFELTEARAWLEGQMQTYIPSWTATSVVWPGGSHSAASRAYALAMPGILQARGVGVDYSPVSALDMGSVAGVIITDMGGTTYETRYERYQSFLATIAQEGSVCGVYQHGYISDEWVPFFDALSSGISNVSTDGTFSDVMNLVRENDDHMTGPISYRCSTETDSCMGESDYHLKAVSANSGASPFVHGSGAQYDLDGNMVWSDDLNRPVYHWADGVDIGPYAYGGPDKVYLGIVEVSEGVFEWQAIQKLFTVIGINNVIYDADGVSQQFASRALALAAMISLADDTYLFGGPRAILLYSNDQSADADRINRYCGN